MQGPEQYNTNKALLDAVSTVVVGMKLSDFVKEAVKRIPAAELEFGELYAEQRDEGGESSVAQFQTSSSEGEKCLCYLLLIYTKKVLL